MSRFRNVSTGLVVSVDDSKDERFRDGWEPAEAQEKKPAAKKSAPRRKSE